MITSAGGGKLYLVLYIDSLEFIGKLLKNSRKRNPKNYVRLSYSLTIVRNGLSYARLSSSALPRDVVVTN